MLAASPRCSNVLPDDLQAAPVVTFARITAQRLQDGLVIDRLQSQPAKRSENQTAGQQARRRPIAVTIRYLDLTRGVDANLSAATKAAFQARYLKVSRAGPNDTASSSQRRVKWQNQNQDKANRVQNATARQDDYS